MSMVATRYFYSRGRAFTQGVLTACTVLFGFIAIFFTGTPKLSNQESSNESISTDFFYNTAHAEVPFGDGGYYGDGGGGGSGAGGCGGSGAGGAGGCGK